jgi:hypothetical protein
MPELKNLEELTISLKEYILLNVELIKLEATNQLSKFGASFVSSLVAGISVLLCLITLSIGVGFYLSALLGNSYIGFLIIAAFYFVLTIIVFLTRKRCIEKPVCNKIIEKILESKES